MNNSTRIVVLGAVIVALTVVLGWMPVVFLLPTLFSCCVFGFGMSLFAGAAFGVISLLYSFIMPSGLVAVAFVSNPWIPIVPRIIVALGAHAFYLLASKVFHDKKRWIAISLTAIIGSLLNTVTVGLSIMFFADNIGGATAELFSITVSLELYLVVMGSIEAVVTAIVTPPVVLLTEKVAHGVLKK